MERAMVVEWVNMDTFAWEKRTGKRGGWQGGGRKRNVVLTHMPKGLWEVYWRSSYKAFSWKLSTDSSVDFSASNYYLSSICFIEDIISFVFPSKEDIASVFCCNEHSAFCRNKGTDISDNIFQFSKAQSVTFNECLPLDKECSACYRPWLGLTGMYKQNADNARADTPQLVFVRAQQKKPLNCTKFWPVRSATSQKPSL